MPEGNLWTRLFIQRVLFKESESKSIVSSDISRMAWISNDGFFMDQSCVFINHETVHMYILSDGNARKDHAVLNHSARFDHTSTSDDGVLDSSLDQTSVGDNGILNVGSFEILCRTGVIGSGIDRPVFVKQPCGCLEIDQGDVCVIITLEIRNGCEVSTMCTHC